MIIVFEHIQILSILHLLYCTMFGYLKFHRTVFDDIHSVEANLQYYSIIDILLTKIRYIFKLL